MKSLASAVKVIGGILTVTSFGCALMVTDPGAVNMLVGAGYFGLATVVVGYVIGNKTKM